MKKHLRNIKNKALLVGSVVMVAASAASAQATLVTDAVTEIGGMATDALTIGAAIIGVAAAIGLIGLVRSLIKRH